MREPKPEGDPYMRLLHRDRQHEADDTSSSDDMRVAPAADTDRSRDGRAGHAAGVVDVTPDTDRPDRDRTAVAEHPPVARRDDERERRTTVRERTWTFAPGQIVSFAAGVGLIAVGLVALIRAGIDGSLSTPTVDVLTYSHTAWLGLAEIGLGLLLLLAGSGAWGRPLSVLLGAATVVAGVLVLAEPSQMPEELGLEKNYGWPLVALGAVVALAAMTLPVWRRRKILDDDVLDLRDDRVARTARTTRTERVEPVDDPYEGRRVPF
jgi:hypothetical protein